MEDAMQLHLIGVLTVFAGMGQADDAVPLVGEGITDALMSRSVQYTTGARQKFLGAGVTIYESRNNLSAGSWKVEGDRYCSQWPPSDGWSCFAVSRSKDGLNVRFADDGGEITIGRYVDMH